MVEQFRATAEMFKEFVQTLVWADMCEYFNEKIELNRDILEGLKTEPGSTEEMIRGRLAEIRETMAYVEAMASGEVED